MLHRHRGREVLPEHVPQPFSILDEDADDELLAILARDRGEYAHYGRGYFIDADAWWALEQRNNPMPYRLYAEKRRHELEAYQAREDERKAKARARQRQEWIDMLEQAAAECRGTCYDDLVADLERDAATIRSWPPEQIPGHLDRTRFNQELVRRKEWIDRRDQERSNGTHATGTAGPVSEDRP